MVKMSENSRHLARLLIERMPAYFPPEKLQFFDETGGVGVEFSKLPFDHLLFTGSGATGRAVMAAAAQNLCPVTLELGGKAPAIVCDDFPLRAGGRAHPVRQVPQRRPDLHHRRPPVAAAAPRSSAFVQAGARDRAGALPARWTRPTTPRSSTSARSTACWPRWTTRASAAPRWCSCCPARRSTPPRARSRRTSCSTRRPTACCGSARSSARSCRSAATSRWTRWSTRINAGPRPLAIYPFSHDRGTVQMLLDRVMSGGVSVNDALFHVGQHDLPFGGVGESGMGHYHGQRRLPHLLQAAAGVLPGALLER